MSVPFVITGIAVLGLDVNLAMTYYTVKVTSPVDAVTVKKLAKMALPVAFGGIIVIALGIIPRIHGQISEADSLTGVGSNMIIISAMTALRATAHSQLRVFKNWLWLITLIGIAFIITGLSV